jgi:hypothetical protein
MTTITTILVPAHRLAVVGDGFEYRAECSCGWAGDWQASAEAAEVSGREHTEAAVGPADGLDRAMTELLDLQDDLAAAVVWLAEHWSADLPAPHVYSATHYGEGIGPDGLAGVRLLVACADDELARAAACLGAPITADPARGRGDTRYRRAIRRIGRVRIEALTRLEEGAS